MDRLLIRFAGLPYLRLTRDALIHERCEYLMAKVREIGKAGLRILDVGCGSGMALYYLSRFCRDVVREYVGVDMEVRRLHKRWDFVKLPHAFYHVNLDQEWDFGKFDLVWCSEVIEHLTEDERLFNRMSSHLDSAGVLIITTPSRPFVERMGRVIPGFDRVSPAQDGGHVRVGYELGDFERMAQRNGLSILSHSWLSPCSEAELRVRCQAGTLARSRQLLINLRRGTTPLKFEAEADSCAGKCWSLAVQVVNRNESERLMTALPHPARVELRS